MTEPATIAPGLHRWTALHADWNEEVASVAVETSDGLVVIDPIDPPRRFARPAHILITVFWHHRDAAELPGSRVWAAGASARRLRNRGVEVTDPLEGAAAAPGAIRAIPTARSGEVAFWLPAHKTAVFGDVLLGAGAKPRATPDPLRLCPERWLGGASLHDLRSSLRPLLELPVQRVLPSHGAAVLRGGKRALQRVLDDTDGPA